ncbi:MAG: hydroxymethylglutaryl-CoA lyase [Bacteroidota bacterium]|nr:hydroxymethylglutaryl-CoA lyase [Bacteroidota bacterium]
MPDRIKILETPRDAMQGIKPFIPTEKKADYINSLLRVGFDIIDFGSFVSPAAIPQLRDTAAVLKKLDLTQSDTKLMCIVGNLRGTKDATQYEEISFLGYPHSVSDKFLMLNINSSLDKSRDACADILEQCEKTGKELVVYLSMAFGNNYGEEWSVEILEKECNKLNEMGVKYIALSDTIGASYPASIAAVFMALVPAFPHIEFSLHLHTKLHQVFEKLDAAYQCGCMGFDGVMNGLGGCPMAEHELVGNVRTGMILECLENNKLETKIDKKAFEDAITKSITTFALIDLQNKDHFLL